MVTNKDLYTYKTTGKAFTNNIEEAFQGRYVSASMCVCWRTRQKKQSADQRLCLSLYNIIIFIIL